MGKTTLNICFNSRCGIWTRGSWRRHRGTNSVAAIKRKKLSNDGKNPNTTVSTFSDENTNTAASTSSDKDKEAIACEVMEAASYL